MFGAYPVTCPHQGCDWYGKLVSSLVWGGAEAEIAAMQRAWFQCPSCQREWEVRLTGDKVVVVPTRAQGG